MIASGGIVSVFGTGLSLATVSIVPGGSSVLRLDGFLQDGTAINNRVVLIQTSASGELLGSVVLNTVPTPAATSILGLGGLLVSRRRR